MNFVFNQIITNPTQYPNCYQAQLTKLFDLAVHILDSTDEISADALEQALANK